MRITKTASRVAAITAAAAVVTTGALVATGGASGASAGARVPTSPVSATAAVSADDVDSPRLTGSGDRMRSDEYDSPRVKVRRSETDTPRLRFAGVSGGERDQAVVRFEPLISQIGAVTPANTTMETYLTAALLNVHKFWKASFAVSNLPSPKVRYVWPAKGQSFAHGNSCGNSDDSALYYCSNDDTIVISQELARNLWEGRWGGRAGAAGSDFGLAVFVAHEYAHNVQHELGIANRGTTKASELHADCLAGAWARYSYNILDAGDLDEAVAALYLLRDERTTGQTHGSGSERPAAFSLGYRTGQPVSCTNTYLG